MHPERISAGTRRRGEVWLVAALTLALAACGSSSATTPKTLFQSYLDSTNVKNDEFTGSATREDRLSNFAAYFTPEELEGFLFTAYRCDTARRAGGIGGFTGQLGCPPSGVVAATAARFGPPGGALYERNILVRHHSGRLELMPLYVASNGDGATELIDTSGTTYTGGLNDFRRHNDLLSAEDRILAPAEITVTSRGGKLVVVSGHTPGSQLWIVGVLALIAIGGAVVLMRMRRLNQP